mmetsp:Transcript_5013/g.10381  ORF Transcript_5013/g.10381 Transcript_5013/m.10381 type:complete len:83 (+) Transcript_5013:101-349(+)
MPQKEKSEKSSLLWDLPWPESAWVSLERRWRSEVCRLSPYLTLSESLSEIDLIASFHSIMLAERNLQFEVDAKIVLQEEEGV